MGCDLHSMSGNLFRPNRLLSSERNYVLDAQHRMAQLVQCECRMPRVVVLLDEDIISSNLSASHTGWLNAAADSSLQDLGFDPRCVRFNITGWRVASDLYLLSNSKKIQVAPKVYTGAFHMQVFEQK